MPQEYHANYFIGESDMVNAWGGIEAMITHSIANAYDMPCAHSPLTSSREVMDLEVGIVDPRKSPETSSTTYLHCILKGLRKSPKITTYDRGLNAEDISCLIIPEGCIGLPVLACLSHEIPVIAVKNKNIMKNDLNELPWKDNQLYYAENYLEAVGIMQAIKSGIRKESVLRPISYTKKIN